MSIAPIVGRPGTKGLTGCVVFDSTVWAIFVRLNPKRAVPNVAPDSARRYSAVRNWLVETNARGNCG
jgi:hypothetical protein